MIGQLLIGRYLILKQLGEGGFSKTYLAIDRYLLNHPACVVKLLHPPLNSVISIEQVRQLFEIEARSLERLGTGCSHIPTLLAYSHEQSNSYLVEEYIKGENLEAKFNRGCHFSTAETIHLLKEVLKTLEYVHYHRIIHCDIKPSNLIQRENYNIALIDFGAAHYLDGGQDQRSPVESYPLAIGTFGYMPEEQKKGCPQFGSDLYALGISVIQLITGVLPQQLQVDSASGELGWHSYLPDWSPDLGLVKILDRMIRRDYRTRYQTAAEVIAALNKLHRLRRHPRRHNSLRLKSASTANSIISPFRRSVLMVLSMLTIGVVFYLLLSQNFSQAKRAEALLLQEVSQIQTAIFKLYPNPCSISYRVHTSAPRLDLRILGQSKPWTTLS